MQHHMVIFYILHWCYKRSACWQTGTKWISLVYWLSCKFYTTELCIIS